MPQAMTPQEFVAKWRNVTVKERSGYQEHFIDVCRLVGYPTPLEDDPTGRHYTFEAGAKKLGGKQGFADVWMRNYFAWEYKGKRADLDVAYRQLLQYREDLENPPLLIACDFDKIVIHPQFVNAANRPVTLTLDDLLTPDGMATLRAVFHDPERFHAAQTPAQVTEQAAREFGRLAELLREAGADPQEAAHFLIRLLFCLFAEDVNLLPRDLFTRLVQAARGRPDAFAAQLGQLFAAMSAGGWFGTEPIQYFDGRLFDDAQVLPLDAEGLEILANICGLNWAAMEPSILGTLFERSLDPDKRAQLGAHYTSRADILLIMEPVLMAPLRRRWTEVRAQAETLAAERDAATPTVQMSAAEKAKRTRFRDKCNADLSRLLDGFADEIAAVQLLDPACGSGNFLYVALRQLLDLEHEVIRLAAALGLTRFTPRVDPAQLHGIEINEYAHELAQATIWIGYLQWLHEHGFGAPSEPVLRPLDNILRMDAIMDRATDPPTEPVWPAADVIIGNPPFLGGGKMRGEFGNEYTEQLFKLYGDRLPNFSDLCCYWFEKARAQIAAGNAKRAGLLATQGIRGGANRKVLERIKETGDIFWAVSDRDWILDGANVHISMVGFDDGSQSAKELDGESVTKINADLTAITALTQARPLAENRGLAFRGNQKGGPFDIPAELAMTMLAAPNPNGRPNSDVIKPWVNGRDITRGNRNMWLIDFGIGMSLEDAARYEAPFEHVRQYVAPRYEHKKPRWWLHERSRPEMRAAISGLTRIVVTPHVSKHRLFVWLSGSVLPDHELIVFARDDDYFFGVLHSRVHEVWARAMGTQLREVESGFRYTPTTTFETFPFPWPPGAEPHDDPRVEAIGAAARELVQLRDAWLDPPGASEAELKKRTLTNLYNARPTWLDLAHRRLDAAVLDAYGWPHDLSDEELLSRLLKLNLARATA